MTDEERKMLIETHRDTAMIRRALFEVPAGSPKDETPLLEGMRIMWRGYQRGSWFARAMVWIVLTTSAFLAALTGVLGYIKGGLLWFVK